MYIHGMSDEHALAQLLLLDELDDIVRHDGVVVLLRVERLAMVSEILVTQMSFCCVSIHIAT